jgi:hypothetical protein
MYPGLKEQPRGLDNVRDETNAVQVSIGNFARLISFTFEIYREYCVRGRVLSSPTEVAGGSEFRSCSKSPDWVKDSGVDFPSGLLMVRRCGGCAWFGRFVR